MSERIGQPRVVFAHGKESGPWGSKIRYLARIAESRGFAVYSLDYQGLDSPVERVAHLIDYRPIGAPLVLVGSSMGGYVSAMAATELSPDAVLLMAPALYLDGYPGDPHACPADTVVVHGWRDTVVPWSASLRFARCRHAALHLVDDDHRLAASLSLIGDLFTAQLARILPE